jgi:hemerythrin-like domain-containing protein
MKITDILLAEHAVFHNLFDYIEKTVPWLKTTAEIKSLAALLDAVTRLHARTEDDLLMGPLEHSLAQIGHSETFHDEHEVIDTMLTAVQKAREFKQARLLLLQVIQRTREHFDKEERIIFPLAEDLLKTKTLEEMGEKWMKKREMVAATTIANKLVSEWPSLLQPVH